MKKIILSIIIILLISISIFFIFKPENKEIKKEVDSILKPGPVPTEYNKLILDYSNDSIVAFIEIPDVLLEPVVQYEDNEYYLNHDIDGNYDINGSIYLDYRLDIEKDKKILIYGHSDEDLSLPFAKLAKYNDEDFFIKHPTIYLHTKEKTYEFNIFASYVEISDFDYINIESFNGLSWLEHLEKLKSYSQYDTKINVTKNKKVIILQTCSFDHKYQDYEKKYRLVMGIED